MRKVLMSLSAATFAVLLGADLAIIIYTGNLFPFARIENTSMTPTICEGDTIVVMRNIDPMSLRVDNENSGDIIVYRDAAGEKRCHRIFERSEDENGQLYYVVIGDAQNTPSERDRLRALAAADPAQRIYPNQIEGKVVWILDTRLVIAFLIALLCSFGGTLLGIAWLWYES